MWIVRLSGVRFTRRRAFGGEIAEQQTEAEQSVGRISAA